MFRESKSVGWKKKKIVVNIVRGKKKFELSKSHVWKINFLKPRYLITINLI